MTDPLVQLIRNFLSGRISPGQPILLGYSGGPDSKALLHLLLTSRLPLDLHLAHIDHGWREESRVEAALLAEEGKRLGLPFHLKSLNVSDFNESNREEQARDHRFDFFLSLYEKLKCQALLLAHQADDQAEVVLKRLFEGASLFHMGNFGREAQVGKMKIWRPLLLVPKKKIYEWLAEHHLCYFEDPTNQGGDNLRAKMRREVIPQLSDTFGKEIAANLCRLGEEAKEVKEYFQALNQDILETTFVEAKNFCLDLTSFLPMPRLQLKFLLKDFFFRESISLPRSLLEEIGTALFEGVARKKFQIGKGEIHVIRKKLYFSKSKC